MIRLSDVMKNLDCTGHDDLGFLIFAIMCKQFMNKPDANEILEGLSPERIFLNDDWEYEVRHIWIDDPNLPYSDYPYFPPQYLDGDKWDASCTVFALCTIMYEIWSCSLPYVDNPDDLVDDIDEYREQNLAAGRRYPLFLDDVIPEGFHDFFKKGLSLQKENRYQSLKDAVKDFVNLPFEDNLSSFSDFSDDRIVICRKASQLQMMHSKSDIKWIREWLKENE